ncbi:hypothetical protein HRM2_39430 [Desulforapulum autotrophicum HRM2]|uniref:Uncharacterized protein n=1 Tax=Desulforapulum autotrophicum (strain ATCC 43914 / DSM 3382 / VKM B-1955 / HRM2) TaxID=177437 RepID=C0QBJ9_DESAH|nr:hypothetical protein HRM2_39430 [Desulforapulum autotrophicum HRM2]
MIILINDANILLIDLLKIDLLTSFFRLSYEFHVTDVVLSIPDCSCLFHSKNRSGRLLTGNAALESMQNRTKSWFMEFYGFLINLGIKRLFLEGGIIKHQSLSITHDN